MSKRENPALVVTHQPTELKTKPGGGSERKKFDKDIPKARIRVREQWTNAAEKALANSLKSGLREGVVKVILKKDALAKSHRPHYLIEQAGRARVIGSLQFGTLLVSFNEGSLKSLQSEISDNTTSNGIADVTTIEKIEPYGIDDVFAVEIDKDVYGEGAIVSLFDYLDEFINAAAKNSLIHYCERSEIPFVEYPRYFQIQTSNKQALKSIAKLAMVRTITPNALIEMPDGKLEEVPSINSSINPPSGSKTYPVVGLLDSGIHKNVTALKPWIVGSSNAVSLPSAPHPSDFEHGTFIAGLLVNADGFNPGNPDFPGRGVKIFDARVFSKAEGTTATDLVARVADVIKQHPEIHVWNLSLGVPIPILDSRFTVLASELDELASKHGVLFVIAAGNYKKPLPLRPWPKKSWAHDGQDLIGSPADSALSLTVGSIAHEDHVKALVKKDEPTGYSRRGPGPGNLPKPEVVHFGGNSDASCAPYGGVVSYNVDGSLRYCAGTSYSAPLVASLAARIWTALEGAGHKPNPQLVRAFIVHSAAMNSPKRKPEELRYFGFGRPMDVADALMCSDDMFTTIHTVNIPRGKQIHHQFPMPTCLMAGGIFKGEIIVTLCYEPLLKVQGGAEYCRSNVNVSMGPMVKDKDNKLHFKGSVPPDPKLTGEGYEQTLIEHGFKWSPVKVYRRKFPVGVEGKDWQLRFDMLLRAGEPEPALPQTAYAIVTVRGLSADQMVYRDGVRELAKLGHVHTQLINRQQIRV